VSVLLYICSARPLIYLFHQPAALQCIAVLAGETTRQFVLSNLFNVGNAMVLQYDARCSFDEFVWAVEALENVSTS
jgi:hypothetical protein